MREKRDNFANFIEAITKDSDEPSRGALASLVGCVQVERGNMIVLGSLSPEAVSLFLSSHLKKDGSQ